MRSSSARRGAPALGLVVALVVVCATGCFLDDDDDDPARAALATTAVAPVTSVTTPSNVVDLVLEGDTVVLSTAAFSIAPSLFVSSVDPGRGRPAPVVELDLPDGLEEVIVSDGWVTWRDAYGNPATDDRLRVFDMRDLGDASPAAFVWSPSDATTFEVRDHDLAGDWLGVVGWLDDDDSVPARVRVVDLATGTERDLGPTTSLDQQIELSDRLVVWLRDDQLWGLEAPFDSSTPFVVADVDAGGTEAFFEVVGGLAVWNYRGVLYVFDVDRPVVADENPRALGNWRLRGLTSRFVLYTDVSRERAWLLDAKDPDAVPEMFYTERADGDFPPTIGGRFVAWARCENTMPIGGGPSLACRTPPDRPEFTVHVVDLDTYDGGAPEPTWAGRRFQRIRELVAGEFGVAWRAGEGEIEEVAYWGPTRPVDVPLVVYDGVPNGEGLDLDPNGLAFFTDDVGELRTIYFVDAMDLVLDPPAR